LKILLDTHAFLWFVLGDSRLSPQARLVVEDASNEVLISPASYWEIAIKISIGKYRLHDSYETFWRKGMDDNSFDVLPIELSHTTRLLSMPHTHRDPFDRLLVAQAIVEGIPLISSDPIFDSYGINRIW
jgi:PIN domain nuclease of toxin-antitoxin system